LKKIDIIQKTAIIHKLRPVSQFVYDIKAKG